MNNPPRRTPELVPLKKADADGAPTRRSEHPTSEPRSTRRSSSSSSRHRSKTKKKPQKPRKRRGVFGWIGAVFTGLIGWLFRFGVAVGLAFALFLGLYVLRMIPTLPDVDSVADIDLQVPLRVYTANDDLIAEYGDERRFPLSIDDVPQPLVDAILGAEDDGFYHHPGIAVSGIARALMANLRTGDTGQGASTITMQVARNYFLTPEKTYSRKLKEMLLAFRLEGALSKDQILELYLNKIFLGHRAYGFAAAAQVYYDTPLADLTLPQFAMLAGLPKAPSRDNPLSNPDNAKDRRNYVLRRMRELDKIDQPTFESAREAPISAQRYVAKVDFDAPYMAEMVRQYIVDNYGNAAYSSGFHVKTTIKREFQKAADQALRRGIIAYDKRHGYRGPVKQIDPGLVTNAPAEDPDRATYFERLLADTLADVPISHELIAGIVTAVDAKSATVVSPKATHTLEFDEVKWAREYKHARQRGPEIKQVDAVLTVGDVVHVHPVENDSEAQNDTEEETTPRWALGQLPDVSGALVSLDSRTGAILALSGGFDYYLSKFNRATQAVRQPGSNIKPFIYSAAIDKGFTASTLVSGAPIVVSEDDDDVWRPENYSGKFFGPTRIRKALSLSLNLVSVRLLRAIGPGYARTYLERFGFKRNTLPKGLSLALGSASMTPLQVVSAYSVFANGGYRIEPYFVAQIAGRDSQLIEESLEPVFCEGCANQAQPVNEAELDSTTETEQDTAQAIEGTEALLPTKRIERIAPRVLDEQTAFLMTSIMKSVVTSGTAKKALALKRGDIAGKTGTTNDFRDAWFTGFTPDVVTTVWIGFDQPADLGRSEAGSKAALPIWVDYLSQILPAIPAEVEPTIPQGVTTAFVNKDSGEIVPQGTPDSLREYFIAGSAPGGIPATQSPADVSTSTVAQPVQGTPAVTQPPSESSEGLF